MNSKFLTNEQQIELGDGLILYYGSQKEKSTDVISITVKGKFRPKIASNDYKPLIKQAKDSFLKHGNVYLANCDWINKHYIFTTDFTECGITKIKTCKFKFQIYVSPVGIHNIEDYKPNVLKIGEDMCEILESYMIENGFEFDK